MTYPPHLQLRLVKYLELTDEEQRLLEGELQHELNEQVRLYGKVRGDLYERVVPHMDDKTLRLLRASCRRAYPYSYFKRWLGWKIADIRKMVTRL